MLGHIDYTCSCVFEYFEIAPVDMFEMKTRLSHPFIISVCNIQGQGHSS